MGPGVAKVSPSLDLRNLCNTRRTQGSFQQFGLGALPSRAARDFRLTCYKETVYDPVWDQAIWRFVAHHQRYGDSFANLGVVRRGP